MQKKEASITPRIMKWFASVVPFSSPLEIKHTRGKDYFNMAELKEHQKNWLLACTTEKGCTWKIPDQGYGFNPFDVLHYKQASSYIVIVYPTTLYAIEIREIIQITSSRLFEPLCQEICAFKLRLKDL